jgi:hypothetical protein
MTERSAAEALFPHLKSQTPQERAVRQPLRTSNPIAQAMWPSLAPPKPQPRNYYRESLLRNLREINARHRQG